jgi:hypothetical protein
MEDDEPAAKDVYDVVEVVGVRHAVDCGGCGES